MRQFFEKNWVKHFLIVAGMLVLWQIGAAGFRKKARTNADFILQPRSLNAKIIQNGLQTLSTLDIVRLNKLKNLYNIIENRKEEKRQTFLDLYQYHFASASLLLILSSISVVIIFIVVQIGLEKANPFLKTIFFVLATLTSFYAISPLVYKLESNISKNLTGFLSYDNLQIEVYNYALTNSTKPLAGDTMSFDQFHSKVVAEMAKMNTIDFEFDYKVIPVPDFGLKSK